MDVSSTDKSIHLNNTTADANENSLLNIKNYFPSTVNTENRDKNLMSKNDSKTHSKIGQNNTDNISITNEFEESEITKQMSAITNNFSRIKGPKNSTTSVVNINSSSENSNNTCQQNMVPIISVTPHSPGAKYNNILDDSLSILQCIRESVVQMKNHSAYNIIYGPSPNVSGKFQKLEILFQIFY